MNRISQSQAEDSAQAYTKAWCSHEPEAVASFFAEDGRITINDGEPSSGRAEIAAMARGFMDNFPDLSSRDLIAGSSLNLANFWILRSSRGMTVFVYGSGG